jgi:hypothetical protein
LRFALVGSSSIVHDPKTGKVRGLLISKFNLAIGLFEHNPDLLRAAAEYLESSIFERAAIKISERKIKQEF